MYGGLLVFPFRDPPLFTHSVFSKGRHKQMFLFPLRNPWQALPPQPPPPPPTPAAAGAVHFYT